MLTWAARVDIFCFLDSHGYPDSLGPRVAGPGKESVGVAGPGKERAGVGCLLGVGGWDCFEASAGQGFPGLESWACDRGEWLFGHFGYDLAAETEGGEARFAPKPDPIGFPDLFFFIPETLIELTATTIRIGCFRGDGEAIWRQIEEIPADRVHRAPTSDMVRIPPFTARFTPAEYRECIAGLQRHILRGDCYEINFCQEFYSRPADLDPLAGWWSLSRASPNPFACFYRLNGRYLLCASPERYLRKIGDRLFSQPIKGTSARYPDHPAADSASARDLFLSAKDRAENVMIVDLVRNDLSKICQAGSVRVEELYGIYPFPQVFQMISTVTGILRPDLHWIAAIRETFPMGSMTGAPKHRVVGLIDQYERSRRGIFSGAVGYVTPEGDFDFNVVIRSLLYNRESRYLSYQVGSGITFYSDPEAEYAECLIKAGGILKALGVS